jgi:hypothetical protein
MALNFSCHSPAGLAGGHIGLHCPVPLGALHSSPALHYSGVQVKHEPAETEMLPPASVESESDPDGPVASSHDVIKADLGPPPKEVPTGRTVLGISNHHFVGI